MKRPVLTLLACVTSAFACGQSVADPAAAPASTAAPASAAAPASDAPAAAEYTVRVLPAEAKAGEDVKSIIEVTAAPGFHMNAEFPSRVKDLSCAGGTLAKPELGPEDAEVTQQTLRFAVPFKADAAGKVDLAGAASFSVCNDRTCKLIRDEKVAWAVEVK